jgi:hypothetical protein
MKTTATGILTFAIAGLTAASVFAQPDQREQKAKFAKAILQSGQASGVLPKGIVVRVEASLSRPDSENEKARAKAKAAGVPFQEKLNEIWEFTTNQVHRVVSEKKEKDWVYRRVESRPFDSANLCKELLEGRIMEIDERKEDGEAITFAGTDYQLGHRSVEILADGEPLLLLCESCTGEGYLGADAYSFGALYEVLAKQARECFKAKADAAK